MANFDFCCTSYLGFSHCGEVTAEGYGSVELTDKEVELLVRLIREKDTSDVNGLNLKEVYPEIYDKLDEAFAEAVWDATLDHWYTEGYHEGVYEYDIDGLMDYCTDNHDFEFKYKVKDYIDEDGELDEDRLYDDKYDAFTDWLDDFIVGMNANERIAFLQEHMNAEVELSYEELDYEVGIPEGIIRMANND